MQRYVKTSLEIKYRLKGNQAKTKLCPCHTVMWIRMCLRNITRNVWLKKITNRLGARILFSFEEGGTVMATYCGAKMVTSRGKCRSTRTPPNTIVKLRDLQCTWHQAAMIAKGHFQ